MAMVSKSFTDIKKDLRQMFMDRGWGIEIEGETLPYYKVYTAMLDFVADQFYGGIQKEDVKPKPDVFHIENKCPKCGSGWKRYRKSTHEYKCRKCGDVWRLAEMGEKIVKVTKIEEKILPPPKPSSEYTVCSKCNKKRVYYRATTKDYRCRNCSNVYGGKKELSIPPKPKPDEGYYFKCENCGKKRALYRAHTKDYRCRECRYTFKGDSVKQKEVPSKPEGHYYFECKNCKKRRAIYRPRTEDYRCRLCKHTFKK